MKRLISYITILFLSCFTATNQLSVFAGGCSSKMNKTTSTECSKNDTDCEIKKTKKYDMKQSFS